MDEWTTRLTGLDAKSIGEARTHFKSLDRKHIDDEFVNRNDIDSAAGMVMLRSAMEKLMEGGVEESKLVAKLRKDPNVWPAALEIIAGAHILTFAGAEAAITMDHGEKGGRNCDFRLSLEGLPGRSIEFKAVGLSGDELSYFKMASRILPSLCPRLGVATAHSAMDAEMSIEKSVPSREKRRYEERQFKKRAGMLPPELKNITAATVVAHFTEQTYLERFRTRIQDALEQLAPGDECWVAIWWSNGSPSDRIHELLETIDFPKHVLGVIVTGSAVVLPSRQIHHYTQIVPKPELGGGDDGIVSLEDNQLAEMVFEIVDQSAGVRPTLIVDPTVKGTERAAVLFRDGERSHFPFNLVLASDPEQARAMVADEA